MNKKEQNKREKEALSIAQQLKDFCAKYGYTYMNACFVNESIFVNTDPEEKDFFSAHKTVGRINNDR